MKYRKIIIAIIAVSAALLFMVRCDFQDDGKDEIAKSLLPLAQDPAVKDPDIPDEELIACSADSDCVRARKYCCGCNMGGESFSINKKYLDYWEDRMYKNCRGIVCMAIYLCGRLENRCIENKCALVGIK